MQSQAGWSSSAFLLRVTDSELLHRRTQHDLVDVHVRGLLDGVGDGTSDGVRRNGLLAVQLFHARGALGVGAPEQQFGLHRARRDDGGADAFSRLLRRPSEIARTACLVPAPPWLTFRPATEAMLTKCPLFCRSKTGSAAA